MIKKSFAVLLLLFICLPVVVTATEIGYDDVFFEKSNDGTYITTTPNNDGSADLNIGSDTDRVPTGFFDYIDATGIAGAIDTATKLAANGANCLAGEAASGVDEYGVAEGCFSIWSASNVEMAEVGTATYDDVQDWSNLTQSAGVISGFDITDSGAGQIDVSSGTGILKQTDSDTGNNLFFDLAGQTDISLTDNSTNWVYADYNAGSPQFGVTTDWMTLNLHTNIVIGKVYRRGTTLSIMASKQNITDFNARDMQRVYQVFGARRCDGLIISGTNLDIAVSAGTVCESTSRHPITTKDTAGADTFSYWYQTSGVWTEVTGQSAIDNLYYNNIASGLVILGNSQYGVHAVYIAGDDTLHVVYGTDSFLLAEAQAESLPNPPPFLSEFGLLVGKIIVQKSAATFYSIETSFDKDYTFVSVSDHGGLVGLLDDDHLQYMKVDGTRGINAAAPCLTIKDSDATDGDSNSQVCASATDTGSGTEDIDVTLYQQIAGVATAFLTSDADGYLKIGDSIRPNVLESIGIVDSLNGFYGIFYHDTDNGLTVGIDNTDGRANNYFNITSLSNLTKDKGQNTPALDTTVCVFSNDDIDVDDTKKTCIKHDGVDAIVEAGKGSVNLDAPDGVSLMDSGAIALDVINDGIRSTIIPAIGDYLRVGDAKVSDHGLDSNDDLHVTGDMEVERLYSDGGIEIFNQNAVFMYNGAQTDYTGFWYDPFQTNNSLAFFADTSNNIIFYEGADLGTDYAHPINSDTTVYIQSSDAATPAKNLNFHYDSINNKGVIDVGTGQISFTDGVIFDTYTAGKPSTDQSLLATDTLTITNDLMRIVGNGGAVTLTSTPNIADFAIDGKCVIIQGTSNTNTVTIQDEANLAGSGLQLEGDINFTLGRGDMWHGCYDSGDDWWWEVSRSSNPS